MTENDKNYVVRKRAGNFEKILIKIKRQNENYAIVDNYDNSELKEMGYTESEISKMNRISLYDEIIITNK